MLRRVCLVGAVSLFLAGGCLLVKGFFFPSLAHAGVPKMLNYQGRLTDENDVLYDGTIVYMKFNLYDAASGGNKLWSSDEDNGGTPTCGVTVIPDNGVFNVLIGDNSLNYMADLNQSFDTISYYLEIKAQEGAQCPGAEGNYETLDPRQRIVSSGYSLTSRMLSGDSSEYVSSPSDDILGFYGMGGADNTDLYLDLDGTYPWLYSNTDTKVGIDDDLEFVDAQTISTSANDLTLAPAGNLVINTIGGTIDIDDATIDLSSQTTGITLGSSDLNIDSNTLFVDGSANRVGVGTATPSDTLDVNGNIWLSPTGDSALYFDNGAEYLFWDDALWPSGDDIDDGAGFILSDDLAIIGNIRKNVATSDLVIDSHGASSGIVFQTGGGNKVSIASTGNVTLNDTLYGYLTYASIAQPTGATGLNYYDSSANMMLYYDGGISYWRSMQGVTADIYAPEYPSSIVAADGSDNAGNLITGGELCDADGTNCGSGSTLYTFYRWEGGGGPAVKDYDVYVHLKVPDNFRSWASNAITFYYKTESNVGADNYVNWWVYEDGNGAPLMTSASLTSSTGGNWYTDSATNTELSALTAGNTYYIQIRLNDDGGATDYAYAGKIIVYYR